MADVEITGFACCFCGKPRDEDDPVTIRAYWPEEGEERWQAWGAHRGCLIDAMSDAARNAGGPFMGEE